MKTIFCHGIRPETSIRCGLELCDTDGEYFENRDGVKFKILGRHLRIICPNCGYSTRMHYRDAIKIQKKEERY